MYFKYLSVFLHREVSRHSLRDAWDSVQLMLKMVALASCWLLILVIIVSWEAEIWRIMVQGQLRLS
jgi:hypothetical protein